MNPLVFSFIGEEMNIQEKAEKAIEALDGLAKAVIHTAADGGVGHELARTLFRNSLEDAYPILRMAVLYKPDCVDRIESAIRDLTRLKADVEKQMSF